MQLDDIRMYVERDVEPGSTVGRHFKYLFEHIDSLTLDIVHLKLEAQELRQIMKRCPEEYCRRKMGAM